MTRVEVNGVQLDYEITGSGPYLIQIPGAVSGKEGYGAVTPGLSGSYSVIDYDHRGYGLSDRPQQKYTLDVWVEDVAEQGPLGRAGAIATTISATPPSRS